MLEIAYPSPQPFPAREGTPDKRSRDASDRPHGAKHTEIVPAKSQRHEIRDHDLRQDEDSPTTDTLDRPPDKHQRHTPMRHSRQYSSQPKQHQAHQHHGLPSEDVAEGSEYRLEDRAGEQKARACPEAFDGCAVQGCCYPWYGHAEGCCVQGGHEGDDAEGDEGEVEAPAGIEDCGVGVDVALWWTWIGVWSGV